MDVSLLVRGTAFLRQALEGLVGIAVAQLSPGVSAGGALRQDADRGVKPDGDRTFVKQLTGSGVHERAAARCDYPHFAVDKPCDEAPLAIAEVPLAIALEDL